MPQPALEHWAPLHEMTVEEATRRFPEEAGIARYGQPEEIAELMAFLVSLPVTYLFTPRWSSVWGVARNAAHNTFLTLPAYASSGVLETPQPGRRRHILLAGASYQIRLDNV